MQRIRTVFTGVAGSPWYSNLYFAGDGADQDAVDAVGAFWTALASFISNAVDWTVEGDVAIVEAFTGDVTSIDAVNAVTGGGTSSSGLLPIATQGLGRLNTSGVVRNRRVQGRVFVPGLVSTALQSDGSPTTAFVTALQNAMDGINDPGTGVQLVVWSRPIEVLVGPPILGSEHPVTSTTARDFFAVLRSRRD